MLSTQREVGGLIKQAIARHESFIANCQGSDNPQIIEMRLKAEGRLSALEDVLFALNGDPVNLRILAKGTIS